MRLSGHLKLGAEARVDGRSFLASQSFGVPFHLGKAYWEEDSRVLIAQVVNPTAGILEGDRLDSEIRVETGAALLMTSPSASRAFTMTAGSAECRQSFFVAPGGWLEILPEPLVPHRDSSYRQVTRIDVARGAGLFFADLLMPGRIAHGDIWSWRRLVIETELKVAGTLVLRERFEHQPDQFCQLAAAAGMGENACFGNALLVGAEAAESPEWRARLHGLHSPQSWIGATCLGPGAWSIKFVCAGGRVMRETLKGIRRTLAPYYPKLACDPRKL